MEMAGSTSMVGAGNGTWGMKTGGRSGLAGTIAGSVDGAAAETRAWIASRASKTVVAGSRRGSRAQGTAVGSSNEAGRGVVGTWTTSYLGYMSCMALLKSSQLAGSAMTSLAESHMFQELLSV